MVNLWFAASRTGPGRPAAGLVVVFSGVVLESFVVPGQFVVVFSGWILGFFILPRASRF